MGGGTGKNNSYSTNTDARAFVDQFYANNPKYAQYQYTPFRTNIWTGDTGALNDKYGGKSKVDTSQTSPEYNEEGEILGYDDNYYAKGSVPLSPNVLDRINDEDLGLDPYQVSAITTMMYLADNDMLGDYGFDDIGSSTDIYNSVTNHDMDAINEYTDDFFTYKGDVEADDLRNLLYVLEPFNGEGEYEGIQDYNERLGSWNDVLHDDQLYYDMFNENEQLNPESAFVTGDVGMLGDIYGNKNWQENNVYTDAIGRYMTNNGLAEKIGYMPFGPDDDTALELAQTIFESLPEDAAYDDLDFPEIAYEDPSLYSYIASKLSPDFTQMTKKKQAKDFVSDENFGYNYLNRE